MEMRRQIERHFKSQKDFSYFCKEVLGYRKDERCGYFDLTETHSELCKFLMDGSKNRIILMPRHSIKSHIITIGYSLWRMVRDPNIRILIYSDSATKAQGFLYGIKTHIEGKAANSSFREMYPKWETDPHKGGTYNESKITVSVRKFDQKEPSVDTGGIESSKIGMHYDLIIFDDIVSDLNVTTKAQMDKIHDCYKKSLSLLKPGGDVILVGCLVGGSKVLMADKTYRAIEDVKVGEKVYSWKDGELVKETVEAMIPQGVAPVYRLKTGNTTIEATPNHPFLNDNGEFVRLENLKKGDRITLSALIDGGENPMGLTEEDCWGLGFMFGDGWITHHPNSKGSMRWVTCFARGVDEKINNRVLMYFRTSFGVELKETDFGYYRTEKSVVGRHLESCGLIGKAKTKRIPEYIYQLPLNLRHQFLNGFIDADGCERSGRIDIEICNELLAKDIKHLAEISGYNVSNIHHRQRVSKPPHSSVEFVSNSYHISFSRKMNMGETKFLKITSIEPVGEKEVFDLTISNTHNFISEGMVVHNTRWHYGDTYGRILSENREKKNFTEFIKSAEEMKDGRLLFEDIGLNREFLDYQKAEQGSYLFSCLYHNNPVSDETAIFKEADFRFYEPVPEFSKNLFITGTCDPAGEGEDFTAITIVGTDLNKNLYVLDAVNKHLKPSQIVDEIIRLHYKWKIHRFCVEKNFFKGTLEKFFREAEQEHLKKEDYSPLSFSEDLIASTKTRTFNRVLSLQPIHERGQLFFPGKNILSLPNTLSELAFQMMQYTIDGSKSPHDDLLVSLAYHVEISRPGGEAKKAGPPKNSAAWLEQEWLSNYETMQRRLPRHARKYFQASLS